MNLHLYISIKYILKKTFKISVKIVIFVLTKCIRVFCWVFLCIKQKKYKICVTYQGIKMYNHLLLVIKSINKNMFKNAVKELIITKCYYSVDEFLQDNFVI